MAKAIVVSALDRNYFPFLQENLRSFIACGAVARYDFGVVDAGLDADQIAWLEHHGVVSIVKPDWPFPGVDDQPSWYKASLCRPFFGEYFAKWDVVMYLDADSWFQNAELLDCAVAGVLADGFAVVPVLDRCHWPLQTQVNAAYSMHWHKECLVRYFGQEVADRYQLHPILHGSFFAGRPGAPHWKLWQQAMAEGLQRHVHFNVDQASMTLALHRSGLPVHFLPVCQHWIGHLAPAGLDARTGLFVEPYQPHRPLSTLTLAADTKTEPVLVKTTDGRILSRSLRYSRRQAIYGVDVKAGDRTLTFEGVATPRFRARALELAESDADVRRFDLAAIAEAMPALRAEGHVCYALDDGSGALAIRREFGHLHFGIL